MNPTQQTHPLQTHLLQTHPLSVATFGAGCFWHVEATFQGLPGVVATSVGYMGGHFANPSYLDVLARITGHAEVAQIQFDPEVMSYDRLLDHFWEIHDPTQVNRQGPDRGEQYRSVIFYHTPDQFTAAQRSKQRLATSGRFDRPIATQIAPAGDYWRASEEHQQYFAKQAAAKQAAAQ